MLPEQSNTNQKALRINQEAQCYGTFAEIGAGQEVARWFFRVGSAAGTVAKTISAYDMAVSDAIYGPTDRYVSRQRLQAMLGRSEEHTSELQSPCNIVCRLLLENKQLQYMNPLA